MFVGKAEAACSALLCVELNQHGRLVAHDPRVMARLENDDLRSDVFECAAVCVLTLNMTAGQEADVCVHANLGPDNRLHVSRPAEAGRIDGTFHTPVGGTNDVNLRSAHLAVVGSLDGVEQRIHGTKA
jgi:hypothetical protein